MVARHHDHPDAGRFRLGDRLPHAFAHGILESQEPEEAIIAVGSPPLHSPSRRLAQASTLCPPAPSSSVLASHAAFSAGVSRLMAKIVSGAPLAAARNRIAVTQNARFRAAGPP